MVVVGRTFERVDKVVCFSRDGSELKCKSRALEGKTYVDMVLLSFLALFSLKLSQLRRC